MSNRDPYSDTIAVETDTVRSVRPLPENAGSPHVSENFYRRPTPISCSRCPVAWRHWSCRTRRSFTIFCFVPVRKPYSKWRATRDTLGRRSASSVCCIPGASNSKFIRMFIVSRPPAASRLIALVGFAQGRITFSPKRCCENLLFQHLLPWLSRYFFVVASFLAPTVVSGSRWHSSGTPQHRSFPQLNFHRARVHRNRQRPRANGFTGRAQNSPPAFTPQ